MKKFNVTFQKSKFLIYEVEAENNEEAVEIANMEDEKFGTSVETPYFLASVREEDF